MASKQDIKIGILTYGLDRPPRSAGRYAIELITSLSYQNFHPILLGNPASFLPSVEAYRRCPMPWTRLLPGLLTIGNLTIPHAVKKLGLGLIHDPNGLAPFGFGAGGAKIVITLYDTLALAHPEYGALMEKIILHFWLPAILPRVDAVIAPSERSKQDIVKYLRVASEKVHVTYLAGARGFMPIPRVETREALKLYGLQPGYILMVGALDQRRNLPRLLEAYAALVKAGEPRLLVIIGKQHYRHDQTSALIQKFNLQGRVSFLGYMASADLPTLYSAADLFVFPSLYESFGSAPLEAMACGVPVVCSNAGALPEVCGDAALMIDPLDVTALADGMRRVLADPILAADLRQRGLRRAGEFSWERTAQKTIVVYNSLFLA
jgi:glycosyltransferase involved in cell wall biosynthesis